MNVMPPASPAELYADADMMTRRQVASLFRVTSAAVASWARRGRAARGPQRGRTAPVPSR